MSQTRIRTDRCPGVFRPWPADDGALVRLRPAGGRLTSRALLDLVDVAEEFGDGRVHLTGRANLQLRGLPHDEDGQLPVPVVAAVERSGLVPSRSHELVRNIMVSPQTGLAGGRADLRPVVEELDRLLCADARLAGLPGRFLFVLDDGRGDLVERTLDLGAVAVSERSAQLRIGSSGWGPVVPLDEVPARLVELAGEFLARRGSGPTAPWHVDELDAPLAALEDRVPATDVHSEALPYGEVAGGVHLAAPDGAVDRPLAEQLASHADTLVITPWRGVLVPAGRALTQPTAPPRRYDYIADGPAIYVDSFATIRRESRLDHLPADAEKLAVRMIHGCGQVDLADDLVVHDRVAEAGRAALAAGRPVLADARMVQVGITAGRLPAGNDVLCFLGDSRVPDLARRWGTTRTAAAVSLWEPHLDGAVVAIGNAPTALFHLLEMLLAGAPRPAAIIGCPVGFIGAAESKEALASFAADHGIDIPFVTVRGRRGGSAMCSSAVNALAQEEE